MCINKKKSNSFLKFLFSNLYHRVLIYSILYIYRDPIYIGPKISMNSLIEKSKKLGLKDKIDKLYNLKNDDLFGNPVAEKWVYMKK